MTLEHGRRVDLSIGLATASRHAPSAFSRDDVEVDEECAWRLLVQSHHRSGCQYQTVPDSSQLVARTGRNRTEIRCQGVTSISTV